MLQRGFLKDREKSDSGRAAKKSRLFFFAGMVVILFSLVFMMTLTQQTFKLSGMFFVMLVLGFSLMLTGLWMNYFAHSQKHRRQ